MTRLTLYRGIAVPADRVEDVIADISRNGIYDHPQQQWRPFIWKPLSKDIEYLIGKRDLGRNDTRPKTEWISTKNGGYAKEIEGIPCICFADSIGAAYYATIHNVTKVNTTSLLISISTDLSLICIDGKDFLYTAIQQMDVQKETIFRKQSSILEILFGPKMKVYFAKILANAEIDRIALTDLITNDPQIIIHHYSNESVISGRFGTKFRSAFNVQIPVSPSNIISIEPLQTMQLPRPDVTLEEFLRSS